MTRYDFRKAVQTILNNILTDFFGKIHQIWLPIGKIRGQGQRMDGVSF